MIKFCNISVHSREETMRNVTLLTLASILSILNLSTEVQADECRITTQVTSVIGPGQASPTRMPAREYFWAEGPCDYRWKGMIWCRPPSGAGVLHRKGYTYYTDRVVDEEVCEESNALYKRRR
jgi:hypothetical protein